MYISFLPGACAQQFASYAVYKPQKSNKYLNKPPFWSEYINNDLHYMFAPTIIDSKIFMT